MNYSGTKAAVSRFLSYRCATAKFLLFLSSVLFFSTFVGGAAAASDIASAQTFPSLFDFSSSVADFDGDSRPDLATVQAGTSNALSADYWVRVQLSAANRQTFRIAAGMGGIQIASRDVNGDNVPDLVLTRKWTEQPVAILLNDGHGTFSHVDPEAFPEVFRKCRVTWNSKTDHTTDAVGIPPQTRDDLCSKLGSCFFLQPAARVVASSDSGLTFLVFLISHSSRAPPVEASHS